MVFVTRFFAAAFLIFIFLFSCQEAKLPYLGDALETDSGKVYPKIADFKFQNQQGRWITTDSLRGKIHVASFIFLSCPTICPIMNMELKQVYQKYEGERDVVLVSYSIDPKRDTVEALQKYADKLQVSAENWLFLTGSQNEVLKLAEKSYYATAYPDSVAPGGFTHSGGLLLVDRELHIRGVYDGTDSKETQRLIKEIAILLKEK